VGPPQSMFCKGASPRETECLHLHNKNCLGKALINDFFVEKYKLLNIDPQKMLNMCIMYYKTNTKSLLPNFTVLHECMELNIDDHMKITHYLYFWLYTKMLGMYTTTTTKPFSPKQVGVG
jgi:hypothetical protein